MIVPHPFQAVLPAGRVEHVLLTRGLNLRLALAIAIRNSEAVSEKRGGLGGKIVVLTCMQILYDSLKLVTPIRTLKY